MALRRRDVPLRGRAVPGRLRRTGAGRLRAQRARRGPAARERGRLARSPGRARPGIADAGCSTPPTPGAGGVGRMVELLLADARPGRRPRILVIGGGTVGDGLEGLYADPTRRPHRVRRLRQPRTSVRGRRPLGSRSPTAASTASSSRPCSSTSSSRPSSPARSTACCARAASSTPTRRSSSRCTRAPYDFTRFTDSGHRYLFRALRAGSTPAGGRRRYGAALVDRLLRPRPDPLGRGSAGSRGCASSGSATSTGSSTRSTPSTAPAASSSSAARRGPAITAADSHRLLPGRHVSR